jgi:simple sugar transport system substrate-binding protein
LTDQARSLEAQSRLAMTRRTALAGGGAALLATALAACGESSDDNAASNGSAGAGNFPETPKYRFVFVNHVTTNPFFVPTQYGAEDACALLSASSSGPGRRRPTCPRW